MLSHKYTSTKVTMMKKQRTNVDLSNTNLSLLLLKHMIKQHQLKENLTPVCYSKEAMQHSLEVFGIKGVDLQEEKKDL